MRLRVLHKGHRHRGVDLRPGDEFDGTESLLANMPDRFEAVKQDAAPKRGRPKKVKANADAPDSE